MDEVLYAIKKSDMIGAGYVIIPVSSFIEVPSEPEHYKDADEDEY